MNNILYHSNIEIVKNYRQQTTKTYHRKKQSELELKKPLTTLPRNQTLSNKQKPWMGYGQEHGAKRARRTLRRLS